MPASGTRIHERLVNEYGSALFLCGARRLAGFSKHSTERFLKTRHPAGFVSRAERDALKGCSWPLQALALSRRLERMSYRGKKTLFCDAMPWLPCLAGRAGWTLPRPDSRPLRVTSREEMCLRAYSGHSDPFPAKLRARVSYGPNLCGFYRALFKRTEHRAAPLLPSLPKPFSTLPGLGCRRQSSCFAAVNYQYYNKIAIFPKLFLFGLFSSKNDYFGTLML